MSGWMVNYSTRLVEQIAAGDGDPAGKLEAQRELERRTNLRTNHRTTRGATTMARTAATPGDGRKKAKSEEMLGVETYADQTLERLQQERTTINNRLSGLGTQIKRHQVAGDTEKELAAANRRDDLLNQRTLLIAAIADKKTGTSAPTSAPTPASAKAKTTAKRSTKRATARKTTARKTRSK